MLSGKQAEELVLKWLAREGYVFVAKNARTRTYEIDLIVAKGNIMFFVEVKYRKNTNQGSGFEYITPRKLKQMSWAAEMWCSENEYFGEVRLMAAEVGGLAGDKIEIIELA